MCYGRGAHFALAILFFVSVLFLPNTGLPQRTVPQKSNENPYEFVLALVESFGWIQQAESRMEQRDLRLDDALSVTEWVFHAKLARQEMSHAVAIVERFTQSRNQAIQVSAKGAHAAYSLLVEVDGEHIAEVLRLYGSDQRKGPSELDLAALIDRMTDLRVRRNQALKLLPWAGVEATQALVKLPENPDERLSRLSVTGSQRAELLRRLEEAFGDAVKEGMKSGQEALIAAAAVIYGVLGDPKWKSLDAR